MCPSSCARVWRTLSAGALHLKKKKNGRPSNPRSHPTQQTLPKIARNYNPAVTLQQLYHIGYWATREQPRLSHKPSGIVWRQMSPTSATVFVSVDFRNKAVCLAFERKQHLRHMQTTNIHFSDDTSQHLL